MKKEKLKGILKGSMLISAAVLMVVMLTGCHPKGEIPEQPEDNPETLPVIEEPSDRPSNIAEDYEELIGDCVMEYGTQEEIRAMLEHGTGVIFFTWTECPWCRQYIKYANIAAREADIGKVLCYDIYKDREGDTEFYRYLVERLGPFLASDGAYDADGNLRIYVPDLVFVVKGEVIAQNNETSMIPEGEKDPTVYWQEVNEGGITKGDVLLQTLCEPFAAVCEALDEINHRGCNSCIAVRPEENAGEGLPNA